MNRKRVQRLWRQEGLKVPAKTRKRRRLGASENGCHRRSATRPHEVWASDVLLDQGEDGKRLKILSVVDEFSSVCLGIKVARRMTASDGVIGSGHVRRRDSVSRRREGSWRRAQALALVPVPAFSSGGGTNSGLSASRSMRCSTSWKSRTVWI